jgi:NADPH-dependent 2,4-dienoyl-CoA reductase/sulfur reductase-like enzyme
VIGLELGSVWRRLGAKVTVVEYLDQILPGMDGEVRKESNKIFRKQGLEFKLSTKVTGAKAKAKGVTLTVEPAAGGAAETIEADVVLVSIGRRPNTDGLALDKAGLTVNARGQIETDHSFRTTVPGIWAIGDVIPGPMLAHKAEDEGIAVAENIAGLTGIVNHDVIPSVVYTWPEIAGVGLTEEQAKDRGEVKTGKFPMLANSRAKTNHEPDGFVKIIADAKTDRVLGVWCIASSRWHDDRAGGASHGIWCDIRRHCLHLPCPPDPFGSDQGSRDGGDRQADPYLIQCGVDAVDLAPGAHRLRSTCLASPYSQPQVRLAAARRLKQTLVTFCVLRACYRRGRRHGSRPVDRRACLLGP